jgi:predicted  nucleic acid-binding Zn-ribbon protein
MPVPWSLVGSLIRFLAPNIPDIIDAVKKLKKEQQQERVALDDTAARVLDMEKQIAAQLQLIEQLTVQLGKLEKALAWATWTALFALVLALIALGVEFFK